jgi:ketose-bisphosphate aldolase
MKASLTTLLKEASKGNYAIIAPDFTSLSMAKAMIQTAEELRAPLILSYSTLFKPIMDVRRYDRFIGIVLSEIDDASIPICLHLDHATTIPDIREAVEVGFCSVMIDASIEPWEINLERTLEAVEIAHPNGVSVESELGQIMLGDGYYKQDKVDSLFTDPEKAHEFVELTGIDALAISIGNVHGAYRGEPKIDFPRLEKIHSMVDVPLVLHGSSGIGDENLSKAIQRGIRKINLYSEMVNSAHANLKRSLEEDFGDPLKLCQARAKGVKEALSAYLEISGSVGSA